MKKFLLPLLLATTLVASCDKAQSPQPTQQPVAASPAPATPVVDSTPSPVWPHTPANAQITLAPNLLQKNYLVVFDESGSMGESACKDKGRSKDVVAKEAVTEFGGVVPGEANLGLVIFDDVTSVRVQLGVGSVNRDQFKKAIASTRPGRGGTPLHSAMRLGYQELLRQAQSQLGYGEYHLIVVTDGESNGNNEDPSPLVTQLRKTPVVLHTLGFCIGEKHSLNQPGVTFYQEAGDLLSLRTGLKSVLAEAPAFDSTFTK